MWIYPTFFSKKKTKFYDECEDYYLDWAVPFSKDVDGKIDCLDSTIHLKQKEETNESTGKCRIRQYVHDL